MYYDIKFKLKYYQIEANFLYDFYIFKEFILPSVSECPVQAVQQVSVLLLAKVHVLTIAPRPL